jgi:hypothetical protein
VPLLVVALRMANLDPCSSDFLDFSFDFSPNFRMQDRIKMMEEFERSANIHSRIEEDSGASRRAAGAAQAPEAKKMTPRRLDQEEATQEMTSGGLQPNERYVEMGSERVKALAAVKATMAALEEATEAVAQAEAEAHAKKEAAAAAARLAAEAEAAASAKRHACLQAKFAAEFAVKWAELAARFAAAPAKGNASARPSPAKASTPSARAKPKAPPAKPKAPPAKPKAPPAKPQVLLALASPTKASLAKNQAPRPKTKIPQVTFLAPHCRPPAPRVPFTTLLSKTTTLPSAEQKLAAKMERHRRSEEHLAQIKLARAKKAEEKRREAPWGRNPYRMSFWSPLREGIGM